MSTSDRKKRIQDLLDECLKSQANSGEEQIQELIADHPELMPELGEQLWVIVGRFSSQERLA